MATVVICFLLGVLGFFLMNWAHGVYEKVGVKSYSSVDYLKSSQVNKDLWRWREPDRKLCIPYNVGDCSGIRDTPNVSSFVFRSKLHCGDLASALSGFFLISFSLLLIVSSILSAANSLPAFAIGFGLFYLGWFFLQYGNRVRRIDLYPDYVEIIARFANFIPQATIYRHSQLLNIHGKTQAFWTMESGQIQPDYKLIIARPLLGYFQMHQTFRLHCNPTQGAWIVGGLNHWKSLSSRHSQLS